MNPYRTVAKTKIRQDILTNSLQWYSTAQAIETSSSIVENVAIGIARAASLHDARARRPGQPRRALEIARNVQRGWPIPGCNLS
jgi:hypothetical protein